MRRHFCLAVLSIVALVAGTAPVQAAAAASPRRSEPSQEYLDQLAELNTMLRQGSGDASKPRDMDVFELNFEPLTIDRIVLHDRTGREAVYHYLAFRLRNEITDDTKQLAVKATRYNEILQNVANQYADQSAKVENAVTLDVHGEKVLDRQEQHSRTRRVSLTAVATDENGSRLRMLEDPLGTGPQEAFNFPDLGITSRGTLGTYLKERIEERVGRRLLTCEELRAVDLPIYNPQNVNAEGVAEGEVYGVLMFNRLSIYGDEFTINVHGLCNKFRTRKPDEAKAKVDNYVDSRVLRRTYVLHYSRPGDEYFEDLHRFTLVKSGWEWVDSFQRLHQRSTVAYTKYFMDNIADDKGKPDSAVEDELWTYYSKVRSERPAAGAKLPDLQATFSTKKP